MIRTSRSPQEGAMGDTGCQPLLTLQETASSTPNVWTTVGPLQVHGDRADNSWLLPKRGARHTQR